MPSRRSEKFLMSDAGGIDFLSLCATVIINPKVSSALPSCLALSRFDSTLGRSALTCFSSRSRGPPNKPQISMVDFWKTEHYLEHIRNPASLSMAAMQIIHSETGGQNRLLATGTPRSISVLLKKELGALRSASHLTSLKFLRTARNRIAGGTF